MWRDKSKQYLEVFIQRDRSHFIDNSIAAEIREVLRKNPQLVNIKIKMEFYTERCARCGKELAPSMCFEHQGKTLCGPCKGAKNDFQQESARRFQL